MYACLNLTCTRRHIEVQPTGISKWDFIFTIVSIPSCMLALGMHSFASGRVGKLSINSRLLIQCTNTKDLQATCAAALELPNLI